MFVIFLMARFAIRIIRMLRLDGTMFSSAVLTKQFECMVCRYLWFFFIAPRPFVIILPDRYWLYFRLFESFCNCLAWIIYVLFRYYTLELELIFLFLTFFTISQNAFLKRFRTALSWRVAFFCHILCTFLFSLVSWCASII